MKTGKSQRQNVRSWGEGEENFLKCGKKARMIPGNALGELALAGSIGYDETGTASYLAWHSCGGAYTLLRCRLSWGLCLSTKGNLDRYRDLCQDQCGRDRNRDPWHSFRPVKWLLTAQVKWISSATIVESRFRTHNCHPTPATVLVLEKH
jgi:hypothetical protein